MAVMNFNTANQTYRQLMGNGLVYTVPRFQRDYSWTEIEWDDLWRDVLTVFDTEKNNGHYMGFLVLQSTDNKNFDVIDGQQQLTTMSMLILAVLAHLKRLVDNGEDADRNRQRSEQLRSSFIGFLDAVTLIPRSKLALNRNNNNIYQNYLVPLLPPPQRNLKSTEHLMRKASKWFYERVQEQIDPGATGEWLARFIDQLADRLIFTVITVADELNAYKVFETLNARGVKLSSTDLLKNYLFSVVHKDGQDEFELNKLDERWESLVGKLGSESLPDFLRTHWNSRYKFVRHAELFKRIREKIFTKGEVFALVRNMEEDADTYTALSKPEDTLWSGDQRKYIDELKMFGVSQLYPLLLAAHRNFSTEDFTQLLRVCSVITFRFIVIGGLSANDPEKIYTSLAESISSRTVTTLGQAIPEMRSIYQNDELFKTNFSEKQIKPSQARSKRLIRYILFAIEKHLSMQDFDFDSDTYNIEHILPVNPDVCWDYISDRDHEQLVYRLGNMTPLLSAVNRDIGNKSFNEKKPLLASSDFEITKRVASENNDWNAERIANRQRWMASQATSIWRINQLS